MDQHSRFVAQGESSLVCRLHLSLYSLKQSPSALFGKLSHIVQIFGQKHTESNHLCFHCYVPPKKCVYLIVYVNDIVITLNDVAKISQLRKHLCYHFQTKGFGRLKYFLGIEVIHSKKVL